MDRDARMALLPGFQAAGLPAPFPVEFDGFWLAHPQVGGQQQNVYQDPVNGWLAPRDPFPMEYNGFRLPHPAPREQQQGVYHNHVDQWLAEVNEANHPVRAQAVPGLGEIEERIRHLQHIHAANQAAFVQNQQAVIAVAQRGRDADARAARLRHLQRLQQYQADARRYAQ